MTETAATCALSDYSGFPLAIGSVFGVRWFKADAQGRLRGQAYPAIWKPGENVATCRSDESTFTRFTLSWPSPTWFYTPEDEVRPEAAAAPKHAAPGADCRCGFYAFAEGCDDSSYDGVFAAVECYGRVILGTKGLRAEKARIVGFTGASERTRRLYPDVRHFRKPKGLLRAFDLVQPVERNPENDPTFWGAA